MKSIVFVDPINMDDLFGPMVARLGLEEYVPPGGPQKDERYLNRHGGGIVCYPTDNQKVSHIELFVLRSHGDRHEAASSAQAVKATIQKYFNTTTYVDYTPSRPSEDGPRREQYHRELYFSLMEHARFNRYQNKVIFGLSIPDHLNIILTHNLVAANPAFLEEDHWQEFMEAFQTKSASIREFFLRHLVAFPVTDIEVKEAILNRNPGWEAELRSGALLENLQHEEPSIKEWLSTLAEYGFEPLIRHLSSAMFPDDPVSRFDLLREYFSQEVQMWQDIEAFQYRDAIKIQMIG